jgi:ribonuclease BN (tRNA processing enzyme)
VAGFGKFGCVQTTQRKVEEIEKRTLILKDANRATFIEEADPNQPRPKFHMQKGIMQKLWLIALAAFAIVAFSANSAAQTGGGAPKAGTRLITVGTAGGPVPRATRAQSSNLLIVNGRPYLVDAGDGTSRRLAEMRFQFRDLGTIFVTHGHDDHTGGLGTLLSVQWDSQRTQPINVYGPPGTQALIKAAVQYFSQSAEIRISDGSRTVPIDKVFFGHDVDTGVVYQDANVKVTAVENSHFHFPPATPGYGKYKSYSYRFETADRVVVFTGDTGPSGAVTELAKGADLLVTEVVSVDDVKEARIKDGRWQAMSPAEQTEFIRHQSEEHLTPQEIGMMASRAGVKAVVLTHLTPRPSGDDYTTWGEEVKKRFSGQVHIAKDLMEF